MSEGKVAIIAGSRTVTDQKVVNDILSEFFKEVHTERKEVYKGEQINLIRELTHEPIITEVISGCQKTKDGKGKIIGGVDWLGENWAARYNIPVTKFPARWERYQKRAGPLRNQEMSEYAAKKNGFLILIWDGKSRGSLSMKQHAENYGLEVFEYLV